MDEIPADRVYQGECYQFCVLGRYHAERTAPTKPYIVVSVSNPDASEVVLIDSPLCRAVLRLRFHDRNRPSPNHPDKVLMTEADAHAILAFVEQYLPFVETIVCQCDAGLSRSAGLAAALSRILQNDDRYFFQRFAPNEWVYQKLLEADRQRHQEKLS